MKGAKRLVPVAAANGDEEAKKALAEDPLTEDENNAFIVDFFRKILGRPKPEPPVSEEPEGPPEPTASEEELAESQRLRIPFGPFLILAILELLFAGDWIQAHFFSLVG